MPVITFPYSCYVGLAVGTAEVTVPGYVRQPITLATCEDGVTLANLASAQWQHATQSWGAIDGVQLWDAATGGNLLVSLLVDGTSLAIDQYDIARIPASGLVCVYSKTTRPYGRGRYGTMGYGTNRAFAETGTGIRPYGTGLYGTGPWVALTTGVVLQRDFDQQHVCAPGTWAPGPFSLAA